MKLVRHHLLLGCAISCFLSNVTLRADTVLPRDWRPSLFQAVRWAEDDLRDANAQQTMNMLSRLIADMKDAELLVVYIRLYEKLGPKQRQALVEEQAAWLKGREKHAEDSVDSVGGSLAAYESNEAEAKFTEKRIEDLTRRLTVYEKRK